MVDTSVRLTARGLGVTASAAQTTGSLTVESRSGTAYDGIEEASNLGLLAGPREHGDVAGEGAPAQPTVRLDAPAGQQRGGAFELTVGGAALETRHRGATGSWESYDGWNSAS